MNFPTCRPLPSVLPLAVLALAAAFPARAGEPGDSWFVAGAWTARVEVDTTGSGTGRFGAQFSGTTTIQGGEGGRVAIEWAPRSRFVHYQFSWARETLKLSANAPALFGAANPRVKLGRATRSSPRLAVDYHPFRDERWDYSFGFGLQRDSYSFSPDAEGAANGVSNLSMSGGTRFALHTGLDYVINPRWAAGLRVSYGQSAAAINADILAPGAAGPARTSSKLEPAKWTAGLGVSFKF